MKTQPLYRYLSLAALMGIWSCSSSRQTAQNTGEMDDLYGNSGNAAVYASTSSDPSSVAPQNSRQQRRSPRNANPDFNDEQQYTSDGSANTDEYYTELSARKLSRGLSADPGWGDDGTNAYNSGFVNGFNSAQASALSWNRWGFNNTGFFNGMGLGMGMMGMGNGFGWGGGFNRWGMGFGSPFYGNSFAYSPFGFDPFYNPYSFGGFGGYNSFYSPFYGNSFYGGGGYYGRPVYVNNVYVAGADPYRNRTYNRTNERSSGRYGADFDNSARTYNPAGGRRASGNTGSTGTATRGSDGYYARPSGGSSRGSYYYDNGSSGNGRAGANTSAPAYNSNNSSSGEYYARPRQSSRGSYTPSTGNSSGGRSGSSYQQPTQTNQQPSYQRESSRSYSQPQQSQPSYSAPSRSYSAPSAPSGGGGGGSSRGPR